MLTYLGCAVMQRAGPLQRDRQVHLHRPLRGRAMGEEMHRTSAQLSNPIPFFIGKLQEKEKKKKTTDKQRYIEVCYTLQMW